MSKKILFSILALSIPIWLGIGAFRAGLNIIDFPVFQWVEATTTAAIAIVEVVFGYHVAKAIFLLHSQTNGRKHKRNWLAISLATGLVYILLSLPVLASTGYVSMHNGASNPVIAMGTWGALLWFFAFFALIPMSVALYGVSEMIISKHTPALDPASEIRKAVRQYGINPQVIANKTGQPLPVVTSIIGDEVELYSSNGR